MRHYTDVIILMGDYNNNNEGEIVNNNIVINREENTVHIRNNIARNNNGTNDSSINTEERGSNNTQSNIYNHTNNSVRKNNNDHQPDIEEKGDKEKTNEVPEQISDREEGEEEDIIDVTDEQVTQSLKYHINPKNVAEDCDIHTPMLELTWEHLSSSLSGLGTPLESIPKGAVAMVRAVFNMYLKITIEMIADDTKSNEYKEQYYKKFILLPTIILIDRKGYNKSRTNIINNICKQLLNDEWETFTIDSFPGRIPPDTNNTKFYYRSTNDERRIKENGERKIREIDKYMKMGEISKAYRVLNQSYSPIQPSQIIKNKLQDLYPMRENPVLPHIDNGEFAYTIETSKIKNAISKASRGIHAGHDNLSMDIIRQLAFTNSGMNYLGESREYTVGLAKVLDHFYHDKRVLNKVLNFYAGGIIVALNKSPPGDTDPKIRPIRMGTVYPKLVETTIIAKIKSISTKIFEGIQFGVGTKAAQDLLVHSKVYNIQKNPHLTVSQSDHKNAYNMIHRKEVIDRIHEHIPQIDNFVGRMLSPFQQLTYRGMLTGPQLIQAEEGIHQGSVISPLLYGVATLDLCKRIKHIAQEEAPQGGNAAAYLDDVELITSVKGVKRALEIQQEATNKGVHLQMKKQVIQLGVMTSAREANQAKNEFIELGIPEEQILIHPRNGGRKELYGTITMGIPVGTPEFVRIELGKVMAQIEKDAKVVQEYAHVNPQAALIFLRMCLPGKLIHFLRGLTPEETSKLSEMYEEVQMDTLIKL